MYVRIIYDNETIVVREDSLAGYDGAIILEQLTALPIDATENMASPEHLRKVQAVKIAEAGMILSGYDMTAGLLFAEAQALSLDLTVLALRVMAEFQAELDYEVYRRMKREGQTP